MNYEEFKIRMTEYLDGQLDESQQADFHRVMDDNPDWKSEFQEAQAAWAMLDSWGDEDPEPGYKSRFWTRVGEQDIQPKKEWGWQLGWLPQRQWLTGLSASFVIAGVLFISLNILKTTREIDDSLTKLDEQTIGILEEYDILADLEIIDDLEILQELELLDDDDA